MAGRLAEAKKLYGRVLTREPANAEANFLMGTLAYQTGRHPSAEKFLAAAIHADPFKSDYHNNLGLVYQATGRLKDAASSFERASNCDPTSPLAKNNLGTIRRDLGELAEAEGLFRQALRLSPNYADAWSNLGGILLDTGRYREAIESYERTVGLAPNNPLAHFNLGVAYGKSNDADSALAAYARATSLHPDFVEAYLNRGTLQRELGRFDDAATSFEAVLKRQPTNASALYGLSGCRKFRDRTEEVGRMEHLIRDKGTPKEEKALLGFGLGKIYEDIGGYDTAFEFFNIANEYKRDLIKYDIENDVSVMRQMAAYFDAGFFEERQDFGITDDTPIFVLGMPRSGTTLAEQILSSHPDVFGAGELFVLPKMFVQDGGIISHELLDRAEYDDRSAVADLARNYVSHLKAYSGGSRRVVDKLPENFVLIGVIKLMFPNAKVIHCKRGALDTCISNFKNVFHDTNYYSYNLMELGKYYAAYRDMMAHWHKVLPGFVHDLDYEGLVSAPETTIERLLSHCGLEFDARCLEFHKTERLVRTASEFQVRQPMYKSSLESWRRYENHIGKLREILGE